MFAMRSKNAAAPTIRLVPVGDAQSPWAGIELGGLRRAVEQMFRCPVFVDPHGALDAGAARSESRGQCNASALLVALLARHRGGPEEKVIGVATDDLYAPGLTWVFGQAQVEGRAAIVSMHRLAERFYGRAPDAEIERHRLLTEIRHEAGHVFGLAHCQAPRCLMRWSASVEQIEQKGEWLCDACEQRLRVLQPRPAAAEPVPVVVEAAARMRRRRPWVLARPLAAA